MTREAGFLSALPDGAELWADGPHLVARWPEHYQEAGCCGNALPTGECCGNAVPVPAVAERVEKVAEGDPGVLAYLADLHNKTHTAPNYRDALRRVRAALFTDDPTEIAPLNGQAVSDTLWASEHETLRDFLDAALSSEPSQ